MNVVRGLEISSAPQTAKIPANLPAQKNRILQRRQSIHTSAQTRSNAPPFIIRFDALFPNRNRFCAHIKINAKTKKVRQTPRCALSAATTISAIDALRSPLSQRRPFRVRFDSTKCRSRQPSRKIINTASIPIRRAFRQPMRRAPYPLRMKALLCGQIDSQSAPNFSPSRFLS